jgi:hypothetical protein
MPAACPGGEAAIWRPLVAEARSTCRPPAPTGTPSSTRPSPTSDQAAIASFILFPAAMIGGPILDASFDLPVSAFAAAFALAMLAWFAICVRLKTHHLIIWGALLVAGLLPVWGEVADKISVAWLPIGVATILAGIFDHRALVRACGPAKDLNYESSDVAA